MQTKQLYIAKVFFFFFPLASDGNEASRAKLTSVVEKFFKNYMFTQGASVTLATPVFFLLLFMELPVSVHRTTVFPERGLETTVLDGLPSTV